jgi:hypothetical protein
MIWFFLLLVLVAGILIGYGGHTSLWRCKNRLVSACYRFYHYRLLHEPEPDVFESLVDLLTLVATTMVGMKMVEEIQKCCNETVKKHKRERLVRKR